MQSYASHRRFVPVYHFVVLPILIANFIRTTFALDSGMNVGRIFDAATALALVLLAVVARSFALKVQDRVIRLEMRLRLREVLPADMHASIHSLTPKQLIGLRFACDAELAELVTRVLKDKISDADAIKKMVTNWQPDELRA